MSCYEQFHWTPDIVRKLPWTEAQLLSIYFEEQALKSAEDRAAMERNSRSSSPSSGGDWETDDVFGDGDEIDYYEALKRGLVQPDN